MEYSNPKIPEGINTSKTNPLYEFAVLTGGIIVTAVVVLTCLIMLVDFFADKIPFSWEKNIPVAKMLSDSDTKPIPVYLDKLSQKVIKQMALPEGMDVTVHYINDDTVNAFATMGGHIFLYRGLLEKLKNEDELAMVIAHEVAHVKFRHPIRSLSHGVVVSLILSLIGSSSGEIAGGVLGSSSMLTTMHFSRDYEYQSDQAAINTLIKIYGHAQGAIGLFDVFHKEIGTVKPVEFLSTHPLTENRISQTKSIAMQSSIDGESLMTPLPAEFYSWIK